MSLLACDLADAPPGLLARAIQRHVLQSPYLPKASDLVSIVEAIKLEDKHRARQFQHEPLPPERRVEAPVEPIPLEELRQMPAYMLRMGRDRGWISQEQYDLVTLEEDVEA